MAEIGYHGPVVAFDLDDTLFRERDFCRSGFRMLCDPSRHKVAVEGPYPSKEELERLRTEMEKALVSGDNPFDIYEEFYRSKAIDWDLGRHIAAYRSHRPASLTLAEGVRKTLDLLTKKGVRMALITDGRSLTQRNKIEALGIAGYFHPDLILISEETGHSKTESKEMFATVVRLFPEASRFLYVGNNPLKDFYYPNILGWTTLQAPSHPDDVHGDIAPPSPIHAPSVKLESFTQLLNYI